MNHAALASCVSLNHPPLPFTFFLFFGVFSSFPFFSFLAHFHCFSVLYVRVARWGRRLFSRFLTVEIEVLGPLPRFEILTFRGHVL